MDLDLYFERIGYDGPRIPCMATLREIQARHVESIAFENLDCLIGRQILLDITSLENKLIRAGRGGYCFEQNLLLKAALEEMGFQVAGLSARVLWNARNDSALTPLSHMLLRVDLDDAAYIVDVGFGGQTPTTPLLLEPEIEQSTPHEPYRLLREARLIREAEEFKLQAHIGDQWRSLYRFSLQETLFVDYEVLNWYIATHPASHFRYRLTASRADAGKRYKLLDNHFTVQRTDGSSERRELGTVAEMRAVLTEEFRIRLPDSPELNAALSRALTATTAPAETHATG